MNTDFDYTVLKHIGVLSWGKKYSVDFNIMTWNGYPAKYDLRRWKVDEEGNKTPAKGVSLTASEVDILKQLLDGIESIGGELNNARK